MKLRIFTLLLLLTSFSCVKPPKEELKSTEKPYFDLKGFVQEQATYLQKRNIKVHKSLTIHGKSETTETDSVDWEKELTLFAESDINKTELFDMYQVDSTNNDIAYTNLKKDSKVKQLIVKRTNTEITEIFIQFGEINPIYHSERKMRMFIDQGRLASYEILGYQKVLADDTLRYSLNARVMYLPQ